MGTLCSYDSGVEFQLQSAPNHLGRMTWTGVWGYRSAALTARLTKATDRFVYFSYQLLFKRDALAQIILFRNSNFAITVDYSQ